MRELCLKNYYIQKVVHLLLEKLIFFRKCEKTSGHVKSGEK